MKEVSKMGLYELIIFDMDGTLYRFESSGTDDAISMTKFYREIEENGIEFISKRLSVNKEKAEKIRQEIFRKYQGDISIGLEKKYGLGRNEYFSNVWSVDASKYIEPNKRLRDLLRSISSKKALLTTAPQAWAERALKQLTIDDLFDGLWFGDGDIRKPNRKAYLQVTNSLNTQPEKTVIVEDEPKYLKPAKGLGMTTILVGSEVRPWVDYCIPNIYEVQKIIGGG
jgi:putative hydrolase of the HAD superfamily